MGWNPPPLVVCPWISETTRAEGPGVCDFKLYYISHFEWKFGVSSTCRTDFIGVSMGVITHFLYISILNRKYLIGHNFRLNSANKFIFGQKQDIDVENYISTFFNFLGKFDIVTSRDVTWRHFQTLRLKTMTSSKNWLDFAPNNCFLSAPV